MNKFFKDYLDLLKENGRFYKNHWIGCIVLFIVSFTIGFAWEIIKLVNWSNVEDKICEKLHRRAKRFSKIES